MTIPHLIEIEIAGGLGDGGNFRMQRFASASAALCTVPSIPNSSMTIEQLTLW